MQRDFIIANEQGVHARPATLLVANANKYKCDITITYDGLTVDLKSIMGVLSLGVTRGSLITIRIEGVDEVEALKEITKLLNEINR